MAADGQAVSPKDAFLAADVALNDENSVARLSSDRLSLTDASGKMLADVSGLNRVGVIETVKSGARIGHRLSHGGRYAADHSGLAATRRVATSAIVDGSGMLRQFDTRHPGEVLDAGEGRAPWLARAGVRWGIPAVLVGCLSCLLLVARIARRRNQDKS